MNKSQGLQVSNCCKAEMKIVGGDEGTMFYQCLGCSHGCDPYTQEAEQEKCKCKDWDSHCESDCQASWKDGGTQEPKATEGCKTCQKVRNPKYHYPPKMWCDKHSEPKEGWEELFRSILNDTTYEIGVGPRKEEKMVSFISSLLSQARKDTIEEIENRVDALITGEFKDKYLPWLALKDFLDQLIKK